MGRPKVPPPAATVTPAEQITSQDGTLPGLTSSNVTGTCRASAGDQMAAKAPRIHPWAGDDTRRPLSQNPVHIAEW